MSSPPPPAPSTAVGVAAPIEADDPVDDVDSAYGSDRSFTSTSINTEALAFPIENGRRYHAYQAEVAKYSYPNDESEIERLDLFHGVFYRVMGNRLFLSPLEKDKVRRAIDLGTGTGSWALDFADQFPEAEIEGIDLSPIQPVWVAPNCHFHIDNMEAEWPYAEKFDFVFGRYLTSSLKDYPGVIKKAFDNLNPGGWAEFIDFDTIFRCDDGTLSPDSDMMKWCQLNWEATEKMGVEAKPGPQLKKWFEQAGFPDVHEQIVRIPIGAWPKDRMLKEIGYLNLEQLLLGLEGFVMRLFTQGLGWTPAEVQVFMIGLRKEMKDLRIHSYYHM